ncbi:MAG: putative toxin-antitoxin system toxin component, PIN family [Bacteroidota bacterium]|nr:putative toxin-antitoxin system toxin component, PIN family [Bacteroidota bacterium]
MQNQKDRVIIDTNLWISFLLTNDTKKLDSIISDKKLILLFSRELIDEIIEVTQRKKFRKYFSLEDMENWLFKVRQVSEFIKVKSKITICRDPKDNFLLSLSIEGNATHLITGDKDLLVLKNFDSTIILNMADYLKGL